MKFFDEKLNKIPVGYIYSVILFAIIIILFISTYGNIYNAHSDIGREFYIPSQMLKGQVLYKDIFNIFPPLGYFINAFFLKIFGDNVNTFYFIGLVLSIFILVPLYKLTKKYCDSLTAFLVTLTIVITCMFYPSLSNWITPYSYSVLYSLASIVWAIYFLDKYIDDENYKNIIYSSLLYGFSISSKYENILFYSLILIVLLYKKAKFRHFLISILCTTIVPLLSLFVLFIQGCTITDLFLAVKLIFIQANKDSLEFFYKYIGFIPTTGSFKRMLIPSFDTFFAPIVIINTFILIYEIIRKYKFRIIIISLAGITISLKCFFNINLYLYGTYLLPVLLVSFFIFLHPIIKSKKMILPAILSVIIFSYMFYIYNTNKLFDFKQIKTKRGNIKIDSSIYKNLNESIKYINSNTKADDKILCIPEGVIINYLTDRNSDNYLYYLIYPNVNAFGKNYIIKKINDNKYNYIMYSNIKYIHHNQTDFQNSWGKEIYNNIEQNYSIVETIDNKPTNTYILKYND